MNSPNIFATLPIDKFGMGTFSLFPRYATILAKQLSQALSIPCPLGDIYQGLVKYTIIKFEGMEYLSNINACACMLLFPHYTRSLSPQK